MEQTNELKPCPFCGSKSVGIFVPYCGKEKPFITCYDCLADGPAKRGFKKTGWNTRPFEEAKDKQIVELLDALANMIEVGHAYQAIDWFEDAEGFNFDETIADAEDTLEKHKQQKEG